MYDQLDSMQTAVDSIEEIPVFGYVDSALDTDEGIPGHNEYSDNNANNIPLIDGTELSLQEMEKGFRDNVSSLSRAFFTHFFGRSSFNINKVKSLFSDVLETCKADYAHNFRKWDSTATYQEDDVCFLVAYGIRYCFKSLVDDNSAPIGANADGTLSYDDTKWLLLTEVRTVQHPIGKPFLWFSDTLPSDNYLCFSGGGGPYTWAAYPALNTAEFRALLTRYTYWGARANNTDFTMPNISALYPLDMPDVDAVSVIGAKVPGHTHNLNTQTVETTGTLGMGHIHPMNSTADAGSHRHYTGDYFSTQHSVSTPNAWHEDSLFSGESVGIYITPVLQSESFGTHSISVPERSYSHTHPVSTDAPSGAADFGTASGSYMPGTVKAILVVRAF